MWHGGPGVGEGGDILFGLFYCLALKDFFWGAVSDIGQGAFFLGDLLASHYSFTTHTFLTSALSGK